MNTTNKTPASSDNATRDIIGRKTREYLLMWAQDGEWQQRVFDTREEAETLRREKAAAGVPTLNVSEVVL